MSTAMTWEIDSTSSDDTERLGELIGRQLKTPAVVELRSDLGGGKTTFVKGLARGFGSQNIVASPTFTLNKIYVNGHGQEIHHFDFYRLGEPGILADQLAESLQNNSVITVVEWSDIVQKVLPPERLVLEFKPTPASEDERKIIIHYPESLVQAIEKVESDWQVMRP